MSCNKEKPDMPLVILRSTAEPRTRIVGKWRDDKPCKCDNKDFYYSVYFELISVPMYDNCLTTSAGLNHEAIQCWFNCIACHTKNIPYIIHKGPSMYYKFGQYHRLAKTVYLFRKYSFYQIKSMPEQLDAAKKPYSLLFNNCKTFAAAFFKLISQPQIQFAKPDEIYPDLLIYGEDCKCGSKDGYISYKNSEFELDIYNDELEKGIIYSSVVIWFECVKCNDIVIKLIEQGPGDENFSCGQYYTLRSGGGKNNENGIDTYNGVDYNEVIRLVKKSFDRYIEGVLVNNWELDKKLSLSHFTGPKYPPFKKIFEKILINISSKKHKTFEELLKGNVIPFVRSNPIADYFCLTNTSCALPYDLYKKIYSM